MALFTALYDEIIVNSTLQEENWGTEEWECDFKPHS
jgi:hypothetical protein